MIFHIHLPNRLEYVSFAVFFKFVLVEMDYLSLCTRVDRYFVNLYCLMIYLAYLPEKAMWAIPSLPTWKSHVSYCHYSVCLYLSGFVVIHFFWINRIICRWVKPIDDIVTLSLLIIGSPMSNRYETKKNIKIKICTDSLPLKKVTHCHKNKWQCKEGQCNSRVSEFWN